MRFLKHLSRCRVLLHIVDITEMEVVPDHIRQIEKELSDYSDILAEKPCWLVFNKCDAMSEEEAQATIDMVCEALDYQGVYYAISGVSRQGVQTLIRDIASLLESVDADLD